MSDKVDGVVAKVKGFVAKHKVLVLFGAAFVVIAIVIASQ